MIYNNSLLKVGAVSIKVSAEVNPSTLKLVLDEKQTLDFIKSIVNSEIRTQANLSFFNNLVDTQIRTTSNVDFFNNLVNSQIRTPENINFFKSVILEVLTEQGLVRAKEPIK